MKGPGNSLERKDTVQFNKTSDLFIRENWKWTHPERGEPSSLPLSCPFYAVASFSFSPLPVLLERAPPKGSLWRRRRLRKDSSRTCSSSPVHSKAKRSTTEESETESNKSQYWPLDASRSGFSTCVTDPRTDGRTDGRTDRRTDPLIEMRGRI